MTSTSCQKITSCSATGGTTTTSSSTTASATPSWRYIVPVFPDFNDTTFQQNNPVINAFTTRLEAETNQSTLWTSSVSQGNWTTFWIQQLNESQVAEYMNDPAVSTFSVLIVAKDYLLS
jgi:hypothetical protein